MVFHGNTMEHIVFHGSYRGLPYESSMERRSRHGIPQKFHGDHGTISMEYHQFYRDSWRMYAQHYNGRARGGAHLLQDDIQNYRR